MECLFVYVFLFFYEFDLSEPRVRNLPDSSCNPYFFAFDALVRNVICIYYGILLFARESFCKYGHQWQIIFVWPSAPNESPWVWINSKSVPMVTATLYHQMHLVTLNDKLWVWKKINIVGGMQWRWGVPDIRRPANVNMMVADALVPCRRQAINTFSQRYW